VMDDALILYPQLIRRQQVSSFQASTHHGPGSGIIRRRA
jgi:hypothetical protein